MSLRPRSKLKTCTLLVAAILLRVLPAAAEPPVAHFISREPPLSLRWVSRHSKQFEVKKVEARAIIEGPLAFTEMRLDLVCPPENYEEGEFQIDLPEQAFLCRVAVRKKDEQPWREAEVVESQRASGAYNDMHFKGIDPLLADQSPNQHLKIKIFPVSDGETRQLLISYGQTLAGSYSFPLSRLGPVRNVSLQASVGGKTLKWRGASGAGDWQINVPASAISNGLYVAVSILPRPTTQEQSLDGALLLVDTSVLRAAGYKAQVDAVKNILFGVSSLRLACFDQTVRDQGMLNPYEALEVLKNTLPLGDQDWLGALEWALQSTSQKRIIVCSDGPTRVDPEKLADLGRRLHRAGRRLDIVMFGRPLDGRRLRVLTAATGGVVLDGGRPSAELLASLHERSTGLDIAIPGSRWVWPKYVQGLEPTVVLAELHKPADFVLVAGQRVAVQRTSGPLLEHAAIWARMDLLEKQRSGSEADRAWELRQQIIELSKHYRIPSPWTSFLMLESEADYHRFNIPLQPRTMLEINPGGSLTLASLPRQLHAGLSVTQKTPITLDFLPQAEGAQIPRDSSEQEIQLEFISAAEFVIFLEDKYPNVKFTLHPSMNGFYLRGSRRDVLQIKSEIAAFDHPGWKDGWFPVFAGHPYPGSSQKEPENPALTGLLADADDLISRGASGNALLVARLELAEHPQQPLPLLAYGRIKAARGEFLEASRAYGSLLALASDERVWLTYAGELLESLGQLTLAQRCFTQARQQFDFYPGSRRLLAITRLRDGDYQGSFSMLESVFSRSRLVGPVWQQVIRGDMGIVAAVWLAHRPGERDSVMRLLEKNQATLATQPSLRVVLLPNSEFMGDFHVSNALNEHASRENPRLISGGEVMGENDYLRDVVYFKVPSSSTLFPYHFWLTRVFPDFETGYGSGKLEIISHDGKGRVAFVERPYFTMNDYAHVDLGTLPGPP